MNVRLVGCRFRFSCKAFAARVSYALMFVMIAASSGAKVAFAQGMAGHDMGVQMKEIPAPEKLPAPLKMTGIGNSHIAITGKPEAQMWFDQGLNLLHDFWDYESERSFEQAVRVDPQCAMCYWGLYEALKSRNSENKAYADAALANAAKLKEQASAPEKIYIEATVEEQAAVKAAGPGGKPDSAKATVVWRRLVKENPKDLQAQIFLAESLNEGYDSDGEPKQGTKDAILVLQGVLKVAPDDSAANHYWIHAVEPSKRPEQALDSAMKLASLAPASGHMVHMPGHIFYRVGDYAQAEHWFAASTAVDEGYMRDQHVDVDDDWNYVHNLMYGIANLMEEGKLKEATELSGKLAGARGERAETLYIWAPRDGMARINQLLPIALRNGEWGAVLKLLEGSKPDAKLENLAFLAGQLKEFATGMQAVESGDLAGAESSSLRLDAGLWQESQKVRDAPKKEEDAKIPMAPVMPDALPAPLISNLSIMSLELRASILAGHKKLPEAKTLFAQAAHEEKELGYREPPSYIRPVGEAEGAALMRAGDFVGAHAAYSAALGERPRSGFGLYGLARASEEAGDAAAARKEYSTFAEAWKSADAGLPETAHAMEYLAAHGALASSGEVAH
jgi:tetratricopeptide (TPR) repeat protein